MKNRAVLFALFAAVDYDLPVSSQVPVDVRHHGECCFPSQNIHYDPRCLQFAQSESLPCSNVYREEVSPLPGVLWCGD